MKTVSGRQAELTAADLHESRKAEAFIQSDEAGFFADKAHDGQAFREILRSRGIVDGVAHRGRHRHPLEAWQNLCNVWSSSLRSGVEWANATLKR
jgi:IS5 family transposase